jgi:hypothetical protein
MNGKFSYLMTTFVKERHGMNTAGRRAETGIRARPSGLRRTLTPLHFGMVR